MVGPNDNLHSRVCAPPDTVDRLKLGELTVVVVAGVVDQAPAATHHNTDRRLGINTGPGDAGREVAPRRDPAFWGHREVTCAGGCIALELST